MDTDIEKHQHVEKIREIPGTYPVRRVQQIGDSYFIGLPVDLVRKYHLKKGREIVLTEGDIPGTLFLVIRGPNI